MRTLLGSLLVCSKVIEGGIIDATEICRSNTTHVAWFGASHHGLHSSTARSIRSLATADRLCRYQARSEAERDALSYLRANVMEFDVPNMETLGFADGGPDVDGLDNGLVGPTVTLALDAKVKYPWADAVPRSVYYEYVLNYANVNEPRTNWRPLLTETVDELVRGLPLDSRVNDIVREVNTHLWESLGRDGKSIIFKGGQTPIIFDPMSIIAFGYCSCTGTAILLSNALRAAGVPARIVGTPAWEGERKHGNHNWIEVYHEEGEFDFMEPSTPSDPTTKEVSNADNLERDPCTRWFCSAQQDYGRTRVYAARLDKRDSDTYYRLAWEWNSTDVPGLDRTDYYAEKCSGCDSEET